MKPADSASIAHFRSKTLIFSLFRRIITLLWRAGAGTGGVGAVPSEAGAGTGGTGAVPNGTGAGAGRIGAGTDTAGAVSSAIGAVSGVGYPTGDYSCPHYGHYFYGMPLWSTAIAVSGTTYVVSLPKYVGVAALLQSILISVPSAMRKSV